MTRPPKAPPQDSRAGNPRTTETPCALARYRTLDEWKARAHQLRQQVLASAGLLPFPARTPLRAKVFGAIERAGYTVEKAYFESRPGFLVCGNLWRPTEGRGPFPAILSPHGHWRYGRLENGALCSIPDRSADLARQGYIVFSYDMVGYNDSKQLPHLRVGGRREEMWGISLPGLQLWNSIRALDFLLSLPDVDPDRIGCTGASGGGTQTFLLTAVDDRVKVSAPVNMISATYQGGCVCENGPNLRLDTNNCEIGAMMAPRPLVMVSCTGDWTKNTPTVEYPWIRGIYRLYGAADKIAEHQVDEDHNYNLESRHVVYRWFARWLQTPDAYERFRRRGFGWDRGTDAGDLMVFFSRELPPLSTERLVGQIVRSSAQQADRAWPKTKAQLARYRRVFGPAYRNALAAELPAAGEAVAREISSVRRRDAVARTVVLSRTGKGDRVTGALLTPAGEQTSRAVLVVSARGKAAVAGARLSPLVSRLLARGCIVMAIDAFGAAHPELSPGADRGFFTTYNRTPTANSVQDILTAISWLREQPGVKSLSLVGQGSGGIWCLLARALAPKVDACVVDCDRFDADSDDEWTERFFVPLLRRAGDVRTAVALAAPGRLLLHNTGSAFRAGWAEQFYRRLRRPDALAVSRTKATDSHIREFLLG
ncbi:MAG: CocE/NonD family hydrolase [Armatimonadota bacterium]